MKALFIVEKYNCWKNTALGSSNMIDNLVGSYCSSGLGGHQLLYLSPDAGDVWSTRQVDEALLQCDYDLAVVSTYHGPDGIFGCSHDVAARLGRQIAFCWWDFVAMLHNSRLFSQWIKGRVAEWWTYAKCGCINLVTDYGCGRIFRNTYGVSVPQDTRVFRNAAPLKKDIEVSFVGSSNTPDREYYINAVRAAGINLTVAGGRWQQNLSRDQYIDIAARSKICLNFQENNGHAQRKGRTFELAACGHFMLANHPHVLAGFFEEGVEYVAFFSADDLVRKIHQYLANDGEREAIADRFRRKYLDHFAPQQFWTEVMGYQAAGEVGTGQGRGKIFNINKLV